MLASTEMELTHAAYEARQRHEITRAGLAERAKKLRPGGMFRHDEGAWKPQPYAGHAVVTMLASDPANHSLGEALCDYQQELALGLEAPDALHFLPAASFHQTVANTLSAERHEERVIARGLAAEYPRLVGGVLNELSAPDHSNAVEMRMIGVSLFSTALGVLGVFERESEFERMLAFRDAFYGHAQIGRLGIKRTRPFIGHITLGYIEQDLDASARERLLAIVEDINRSIAVRDLRFRMPFAELRAYEHLAEFKPLAGLPVARL